MEYTILRRVDEDYWVMDDLTYSTKEEVLNILYESIKEGENISDIKVVTEIPYLITLEFEDDANTKPSINNVN